MREVAFECENCCCAAWPRCRNVNGVMKNKVAPDPDCQLADGSFTNDLLTTMVLESASHLFGLGEWNQGVWRPLHSSIKAKP